MKHVTSLERILSPVDVASFYREYYEKRPLLIKRETSDYFENLLSIRDISVLLERKDIRYPAIRLVKDGKELAQTDYLKSYVFGKEIFDRVVDNDRLFTFFSQGITVVLQALHRTLPPLTDFCQDLEKYFNFPVQTNIYLTPGTSQGFRPHFDNHDVFVLQVFGSKKWKIYDSPVFLPKRKFDRKKWEKTEPRIETELHQGDTLYIPRGFVHEASTTNSASMHITLGLLGYTWMDVLRCVSEKSGRVKDFRKIADWSRLSDKQIKENLADLIRKLLEDINPQEIKKEFSKRLIRKAMSSDRNRLADLMTYNKISPATTLALRDDIIYNLEKVEGFVKLSYYNKTISFPEYVYETICLIIEHQRFSISGLGGRLNENGNLILCKKLLQEGFLTICDGA